MAPIKLAVGIPTYSGIQNAESLLRIKREFKYIQCFGHPVVPQARNIVLNEFFESDCTHLLSLDGDIHFSNEIVEDLIKCDLDLVGVVYARRNIKGLNVQFLDPKNIPYEPGKPLQVKNIPLGMMLISKAVLVRFVLENPNQYYVHYDKKGYAFCEASLNTETRGLECDGYDFCKKMRAQGEKIYCLPYWAVNHAGKIEYLAQELIEIKSEQAI